MPRLVYETPISAPVEALWEFHSSAEALHILTPPKARIQVMGDSLAVENGAIHRIRVRKNGLPVDWVAEISEVIAPRQFRDTAVKSPFKSWTHLHEFLPHEDGCLLRDTVDYELPFGPLGAIANHLFVRHDLDSMFVYRHDQTKRALESGALEGQEAAPEDQPGRPARTP